MKNEDHKNFMYAKELCNNYKYIEAVNILQELYYNNQKDINIKFELARSYYKGSYNIYEARRLLKELLFTKNKTYAKLELGKLEKSQGNIEEARRLFTELKDDEYDSFAMLELGILEREQGNYNEAYKHLNYLVDNENNSPAKFELGKLEKEQGNFEKAIKIFESLDNFENSINAKLELAILKREQGYFEEARRYLTMLNSVKKNIHAMLELAIIEKELGNYDVSRKILTNLSEFDDNTYAMLELVYLDIKTMNYEMALQNLEMFLNQQNRIMSNASEFNRINVFLKYKLGKISKINTEINLSYFYQQLFDYNEEKVIEHIKLHLDENDDKNIQLIFNENINIEELFETIKAKINDTNPRNSSLTDKYIISLDDKVGTCNNKETNCIEVVTYSNTKDIITFYPIYKELGLNNKEEKIKNNTNRQRTDLDRFNAKYSII